MFIWNQDRDGGIVYDGERLFCMPVFYKNAIIGINLYAEGKDDFLGTFDSVGEAISEMIAIQDCMDEHYFVRGYHDVD